MPPFLLPKMVGFLYWKNQSIFKSPKEQVSGNRLLLSYVAHSDLLFGIVRFRLDCCDHVGENLQSIGDIEESVSQRLFADRHPVEASI